MNFINFPGWAIDLNPVVHLVTLKISIVNDTRIKIKEIRVESEF